MIAGEAAGKTAAMPRAPMVKQKEMNVPLKIYAPSMAWVDDGGPVGNAMMLLEFQIGLSLTSILQALENLRQGCGEKKSISPGMPAPKTRSANRDQLSDSSSDWHIAPSEWSVLPQDCSPLPPIPTPTLGDGHGSHKGNQEDNLQSEPSSDWTTMIDTRATGELSSFSSSNKKWVIFDSADEETFMQCHIRKLSSRPIQKKKPTPELDVPAYEALCRNAKEAHQKALEEARIRNIQEANALADARLALAKAEEAEADKAQVKAQEVQEVQVENTQKPTGRGRGSAGCQRVAKKYMQNVVMMAHQENMKASAKVTKKNEEKQEEEEHDGRECKQA